LIPVEDVQELRDVCNLVKQISSGLRCDVDKKRKRIALAPSMGTIALLTSRRIGPALLGAAQFQELLEHVMKVLEEVHGIKLVFDGSSTAAALVGVPIYYYRVFKTR